MPKKSEKKKHIKIEREERLFNLQSEYTPAGDQPAAIAQLVDGLEKKKLDKQTLLGVTGSGKTFTIANVIQQTQRPTLVIAHNKTLAAQLAQEFQEFFPDNAVHYFVSYYDYYQPEAYVSATDTYIEKEAMINDEIDRLRHATTQALLSRTDVIIVASVSCIYGLGSPIDYINMHLILKRGGRMIKRDFFKELNAMQFNRTTADLTPGTYRSVGNRIEIMPVSEKVVYQINLMGSAITNIAQLDPISFTMIKDDLESLFIFPAKHFMTNEERLKHAIDAIQNELADQVAYFEEEGKLLEEERIRRRTTYDLAMLREVGYCRGIENYSRHLSGKAEGEAPETLLSYFPHDKDGNPDFLLVIDESHVTVPQLGGMYNADRSRKQNLVDFGFRLPSARDNRPLQSEEFWDRIDQTIFVSATPGAREADMSDQTVEQIIRPTGLVDPEVLLFPVTPYSEKLPTQTLLDREGNETSYTYDPSVDESYPGQIQHLIDHVVEATALGGRILVTTLTKKMAEDLSSYLKDKKIKTEYLHSDVKTIDRIRILTSLRKGEIDCLVGVNLLREGLDLPEVTLVAILDADKEGFLRSETSMIQTIGRAARNVDGHVHLYADRITGSMQRAMEETDRRRKIQLAYNKEHNITPQTIIKSIKDITEQLRSDHNKMVIGELERDLAAYNNDYKKLLTHKAEQMERAVEKLDFETAAIIRDEMKLIEDVRDEKSGKGKKGKKKSKN